MGGQACVFYGAAEFSRDCDIAVLCNPDNLQRLQNALAELEAHRIAVPPFEPEYLERGHAVHFRCQAAGVERIRVDVMSKMRGVDAFEELWERRTTITDDTGTDIHLMALPDLVAAKKTQRDKDWPMIRRLVEAHLANHRQSATEEQVRFWLSSSRTAEHLINLAADYPEHAESLQPLRPLLEKAIEGNVEGLRRELGIEQTTESVADQQYWRPLKQELEKLRQRRN